VLLGCVWQIKMCGEDAAEKPFLEECLAMCEANEKMVLEPLVYLSDTLWNGWEVIVVIY
jgi:hypothetical protein